MPSEQISNSTPESLALLAQVRQLLTQLYVGEASPTVERPAQELKGFERVMLGPGETKHISLALDPRSFSYFDVKSGEWHADAGAYNLLLGDSSEHIEQRSTIGLPKPLTTSISE